MILVRLAPFWSRARCTFYKTVGRDFRVTLVTV